MRRLAFLLLLVTASAQAKYHVVRHIAIGGAGGWDALSVDSAGRRLYVSHNDRVEVVDIDGHKIAGTITGLNGVHCIAIAHDLNRGYISNGRSGMVTIFDLEKLTTIKEVKATGDNPDAILYDPYTKRVWAFNGRGQNATVFDPEGEVLATVPMEGKPEFAETDGAGHIYVNIEDKSELAVIDAKAMKVEKRWALAPCQSPSGIALDRKHDRLISVCENKTMVFVDASNGKVVGEATIGAGVDGVAFDSKSDVAFSSNGSDGTVSAVREKGAKAVATVTTARGTRTIAIDEKTHHIFTPTAKFGETPSPTTERPRPRPAIIEGSFEVIEIAP